MRILIIDKTAGLLSSHERHQALAKQPDVEVHVLGPRHWIENGRDIVWHPDSNSSYTPHLGCVFFKDFYARAGYYSGLCRALRRARPDIIQLLEEPWSISALQTAIAASLFAPSAKVLFYTWENIYRRWTYPSRAGIFYAMIDKVLHAQSIAAVCATEGAKQVLQRKGYTKPMAVIPYGIPHSFLNHPFRSSSPPRPFTIGYIGRFLHMKGIDLLLHAVAHMQDVRLILVGAGDDEDLFHQLCNSLHLTDRVTWYPPCDEQAIPGRLQQMDVLVLPSRTTAGWREQLGRVLIEAMACGVPVIGSNSGAIPEVIGDAGLIFEENSVQSLVTQLEQLKQSDEKRIYFSHKGIQRVKERFTWDRFAGGLCAFYRSVL